MKTYSLFLKGRNAELKHIIVTSPNAWAKRLNEILEGKALLSIKKDDKTILATYTKDDGIGIEILKSSPGHTVFARIDDKAISWSLIAKNEGLSTSSLIDLYKDKSNTKLAIIHLSEFRYSK